MQLGLFFTGVSPSGGASNIWICMLGGNLNLSITITSISNVFAFCEWTDHTLAIASCDPSLYRAGGVCIDRYCGFAVTIPLWTFTLGRTIFDKGAMVMPYKQIAIYAVSLLPPLMIGLALQSRCPKFSQLMVRILKPFSSCLILFIIVFASVTNFYLFKLFTWQVSVTFFNFDQVQTCSTRSDVGYGLLLCCNFQRVRKRSYVLAQCSVLHTNYLRAIVFNFVRAFCTCDSALWCALRSRSWRHFIYLPTLPYR